MTLNNNLLNIVNIKLKVLKVKTLGPGVTNNFWKQNFPWVLWTTSTYECILLTLFFNSYLFTDLFLLPSPFINKAWLELLTINTQIWDLPPPPPSWPPATYTFFNYALWSENLVKFYSSEFAVVSPPVLAGVSKSQVTQTWPFKIFGRTTSTTYVVPI